MSKKLLTKLLAFVLSAGLVLQPVAAFAAEAGDGNLTEPAVVQEENLEDAEEKDTPEAAENPVVGEVPKITEENPVDEEVPEITEENPAVEEEEVPEITEEDPVVEEEPEVAQEEPAAKEKVPVAAVTSAETKADELGNLTNVRIVDDFLYWDPYPDAFEYWIYFNDAHITYTNEIPLDLVATFERKELKTGSYTIKIAGYNTDLRRVTNYRTLSYEYKGRKPDPPTEVYQTKVQSNADDIIVVGNRLVDPTISWNNKGIIDISASWHVKATPSSQWFYRSSSMVTVQEGAQYKMGLSVKSADPIKYVLARGFSLTLDGQECKLEGTSIDSDGNTRMFFYSPVFTPKKIDKTIISCVEVDSNFETFFVYDKWYDRVHAKFNVTEGAPAKIDDSRLYKKEGSSWVRYDTRLVEGQYRLEVILRLSNEDGMGHTLDPACTLKINGKEFTLTDNEWNSPLELYYVSEEFTMYNPAKLRISEVSSDFETIPKYKEAVREAFFEIPEETPIDIQGSWYKETESSWESATDDVFALGKYRYQVTVQVDSKHGDYSLDPDFTLKVNGAEWTKLDNPDENSVAMTFVSPEITVDYPELSNVRFEDDVLSWDSYADEDLWLYSIKVGKKEYLTSDNSINLKEICKYYGFYGGTYQVELSVVDYNNNPISQVYKMEYDYDGPLPKDRTLISELTLHSIVKGTLKEGYPPQNMLRQDEYPEINCIYGKWEIYGEDGWEEYQELAFVKGTYRYKALLSIEADYKDLYLLDPDLKLTVDKNEWTKVDVTLDNNDEVVEMEFVSPEYVLPWPEKIKIPAVSAVCPDLSEYVVKDAELTIPTFTDIDVDEVEIQARWVTMKDGEFAQPTEGIFTPGKWYLAVGLSVKEEYEDTHTLERTTTFTTPGIEWINVSGNSDPEFGVVFLSPEFEIKDEEDPGNDEPEEITGTWYTKWGETYFVTEEGEALTGMQEIGEEIYLFDDKGALESNVFYEEEGIRYYFDSEGKLVIGWFEKWGSTYYAGEGGAIQTGFVDIGDDTYFFDAKGKQSVSIWVVTEDGKRYYFKADGRMAKAEKIHRWGKEYTFDENGVMIK